MHQSNLCLQNHMASSLPLLFFFWALTSISSNIYISNNCPFKSFTGCFANLQNCIFSWCLSIPTDGLGATCSGDQVHQCDQTGPCHKFPFLPSPDCNLVTFKHTNEILSHLLLVYSTLIPRKGICPWVLTLSLGSPHPWLSSLPWHFFHMAPCVVCHAFLFLDLWIYPLILCALQSAISETTLECSLDPTRRTHSPFTTHRVV